MSESVAHADKSPHMADLPDAAWKQRFVARLADLFMQGGLDSACAVADAKAHADDCYPRQMAQGPEEAADLVGRELKEARL